MNQNEYNFGSWICIPIIAYLSYMVNYLLDGFFQKNQDFFLFHLFFLFFVVLGHFVKCFIDLFCGFPQAAESIIKVFVFITEL